MYAERNPLNLDCAVLFVARLGSTISLNTLNAQMCQAQIYVPIPISAQACRHTQDRLLLRRMEHAGALENTSDHTHGAHVSFFLLHDLVDIRWRV